MRAVNLLPREETRQRKQLALTPQNTPVVIGAGLGVVVLGALALGYKHESGAVSAAQQQLQTKKVELANTPKPPPPTAVQVDPNAQLTTEQSARMTAVTTALGARFAWDRVLREFAQILPDDVWLSSLAFTTPQSSAAGATGAPATGLTVVGTTYSHDSVARLLARLALVPELSNVTLQSDAQADAGAGSTPSSSTTPAPSSASGPAGTVSFTITAAVNLPAGATSLTPAPPAPPPVPTSTDTSGASS